MNRVSKGVLSSREDPPIVPVAIEAGQVVELFHLDPAFIQYLDKLAGMIKVQADGYADIFVQMRDMDVQRVQVSTSYRKGHNF